MGTITYPERETVFTAGLTNSLEMPSGTSTQARGWLLYLKSSLTGDEPADVIEYQSRCAAFPHESTGDQFFSESQFESYRRLGYHVLRSAFESVKLNLDRPQAAAGTPALGLAGRYQLVPVFQGLTRRWYAPIPVTDEAATRLADAYVAIMRRLAEQSTLEPLHLELVQGGRSKEATAAGPLAPEFIAFGMELMQLMQNVYTEFKLEHEFNRANPRNSGWISVFAKWLRSDLLYMRIWNLIREDYHGGFGAFVADLRANPNPDVPSRP